MRRQKTRLETSSSADQRSREPNDQLRADTEALRGIPPPTPLLLMMKVISWNIRGLNERSKQRILRDYIKEETPDILMLQETKCVGLEAKSIMQRIWKG
jgi:hypothetical protein